MNTQTHLRNAFGITVVAALAIGLLPATAHAQACDPVLAPPGGTLDPCTVPKYVLPLVIPPVMDNSGTADDYDIALIYLHQLINNTKHC